MTAPTRLSERAIVLAPNGRDSRIADMILSESGFTTKSVEDVEGLCAAIGEGAGFAIIADEAIRTINLRPLILLLGAQPPWSDFPIILLTQRGGGPERNPAAARIAEALGNVTFLERPFHPTTLVSVARTAVRGRRRQYEARLRLEELVEGEQRLQTALTAGRLGSWSLDIVSGELRSSDATRAHFGRAPHETLSFDDLKAAVHADDLPRVQASLDLLVNGGQDSQLSYRILWPDGSEHWVELRARGVIKPVRAGESVVGSRVVSQIVGVSSDITNRKTADLERDKLLSDLANQSSALSRLTATLEQRVRERTRDLTREIAAREKAQEQLLQSQKMESIGQLTGGVAHDFNNLLMAIMGNLDLLKKRLSSDTRAMRLIDGAMRGAHRGASLTKRMLAFARQQDLNTTATDLGELINGMRDLLDRSLGPYITLTINVRPNLSPAEVDANQVELAILNLTINARDAMVDRGAITITIDRDPDENGDGFLAVSIADTGSGMSEETLKRAIEPFFSTKPVGKGTGLGLSMVHGLAVQLGGSLKLKSAIGQGTTATLRLPVAKRYAIQEETSVAEIIKDRVAKILVVDDDALIAMSTVDMLEDLGHKVLEANSGKHALELLESDGPIDLMMTDYAMPGMTGAELAEIVHRTYPHMPILLATGYADLPSGQKSDLPRISKPYLQEQLRVEIGRLLGQ